MLGQRQDLPLQNLHPLGGHDTAHVGDHGLGEDLVDQAMVASEPRVSDMFDAEAIIRIFFIFGRLNINPPFGRSQTLGLGVLYDGVAPALGLHVGLIRWRALVNGHVAIVLLLFGLVFLRELGLFFVGQISPHGANDLADFPQFFLGILSLHRIPNFARVTHVGQVGLLWSLWRLDHSGGALLIKYEIKV